MPSAKDILAYLASISYSDPKDRGIKPLIKSTYIAHHFVKYGTAFSSLPFIFVLFSDF